MINRLKALWQLIKWVALFNERQKEKIEYLNNIQQEIERVKREMGYDPVTNTFEYERRK